MNSFMFLLFVIRQPTNRPSLREEKGEEGESICLKSITGIKTIKQIFSLF